MFSTIHVILSAVCLLLLAAATAGGAAQPATNAQKPYVFDKTIHKKAHMGYLLYLPADYGKDKWPLVLFLHGAGERGDDISKVAYLGPPAMVDAIKAGGGNPKFTIYPGVGHDSWTATYNNEEFWKWLLGQRKK